MGFLKYFFKNKNSQIKEFIDRGAVIVDVRTEREWNEGYIPNAIHLPLSELKNNIEEIKKTNKPVIAYCKSGVRSARATKLLKFYKIEAINGGGMADLKQLTA
ncbi:rhodanese-like domain-containing protein [uncultured Algibacter sp.]|jgi:rhodanese-related sulfurtransferase|uniref:rhodanese-like domain-containing protein n=1 Tax=uncultured Algibacter sp. TaxID=298659 RepID=UPI002637F852|nr:rhodanese-like domain-containing protein [uncultured Algibacter sp.]